MKYDVCNECSHRPDAIARTEDVLSVAVILSEFPAMIGSVPHDMASELGEVAQTVVPYMKNVDNLPARLLLVMRCLYLLGVQRGCELSRAPWEKSMGMDKMLQPFELRDCEGYLDGMVADLACIYPKNICAMFEPFGFTFTEKGEITNV